MELALSSTRAELPLRELLHLMALSREGDRREGGQDREDDEGQSGRDFGEDGAQTLRVVRLGQCHAQQVPGLVRQQVPGVDQAKLGQRPPGPAGTVGRHPAEGRRPGNATVTGTKANS